MTIINPIPSIPKVNKCHSGFGYTKASRFRGISIPLAILGLRKVKRPGDREGTSGINGESRRISV